MHKFIGTPAEILLSQITCFQILAIFLAYILKYIEGLCINKEFNETVPIHSA